MGPREPLHFRPHFATTAPARLRPRGGSTVLTHREWEVLVLLRQARTTAEIAERFVVSHGTVRTHVATIVRKLGADGRASIAAAAG